MNQDVTTTDRLFEFSREKVKYLGFAIELTTSTTILDG